MWAPPAKSNQVTGIDATPPRILTGTKFLFSSRLGLRIPLILLFVGVLTEIVCRTLARTEYAQFFPVGPVRFLAYLVTWTSIVIVILNSSNLRKIATLAAVSLVFLVIGEVFNLAGEFPLLRDIESIGEDTLGQFAVVTFFQLGGIGLMIGSFYLALYELRNSRDATLSDRERLTQEIADRKKAEEALAERERLYRGAIEVAGAVAYYQSYDPDEYPFIGDGIERLIGCTPREFNGVWDSMSIETVLFGELSGLKFQEAAVKCRTEGLVWRADHRVRLATGEEKWISNAAVQVRDDSGKIVGSLGILQDITERKRSEDALRQSEERNEAVLAALPDLVSRLDRDGTYLDIRYPPGDSFAVPTGKVVGKNIRDFGFPKEIVDRSLELISRALDRQEVQLFEYGLESEKGRLEFEARIAPCGGNEVLWVIRDISDRKKAEEERETLENQIRHAQKLESLGVLAGGIAHDFNNLLVGVMGNAGLARMELPPDSNSRLLVEQIEIAAQRAADLTRQMLAYSGKGQFAIGPVHLNSLVEEMAGLLHASIGKNVQLEFDFDDRLPVIEADQTQLRQVVMNLITNGSEAIGPDPGVVRLRTGKTYADDAFLSDTYLDDELPEGDYVFLSVTDTGSGMDPDTAGKIFDPFFTTKFTGRGLGLAAVLGIIRGHRGAIKVSSRLGRGTTVQTLFPLEPFPRVPKEMDREPGPVWAPKGQGVVLVVDDEAVVRDLAAKILDKAGFETLSACDGREGVELFRERSDRIRLVLLDRMMPVLGGDEALRQIKEISPKTPIILSSGYDEMGAPEVDPNGSGPSAFLQKPYQAENLIKTVYSLLDL